MKKQNYVQGALILIIASILTKVIGAIFKIPLTNIIGVNAMAYFNSAYSFYVIFYMISTAGLPVAVSKMVSSADAEGNGKKANLIFKVSLTLFLIIGFIGTALMFIFAKDYAEYSKLPGLEYSIYAIAPTLFFICISSAYTGFFQGMKNMVPTGANQIFCALGKMIIGLTLAILLKNVLTDDKLAAVSIIGVTVGVIVSAVFLISFKKRNRVEINGPKNTESAFSLLKDLVIIAIPVTLSSTIMSLNNTIDTTFMVKRLASAGTDIDVARKIMGSYTAISVPIFNLPPNLIYPIAISIIPALTSSFVKNNKNDTNSIMSSSFRLASIISLPCTIGLAAFATPIVSLLYKNEEITNKLTSYSVAGPMLSLLAISIFFLAMVSITNSVLQSFGYEKKTIISTCMGILFKAIITISLFGNKSIGMYAAPIGTLAAYLTIMCFNLYFVIKYTNFIPRITDFFMKPFIASVLGIGIGYIAYNVLQKQFQSHIKILILSSVLLSSILYFVVLSILKGIKEYDILMLPKGEKLAEFCKKIKII